MQWIVNYIVLCINSSLDHKHSLQWCLGVSGPSLISCYYLLELQMLVSHLPAPAPQDPVFKFLRLDLNILPVKAVLATQPEWKLRAAGCFGVFASLIKSPSRVWLFATPWTAACQASLSLTVSWSSPKFMSPLAGKHFYVFIGSVFLYAVSKYESPILTKNVAYLSDLFFSLP